MTTPFEESDIIDVKDHQFRHNWLYSVLPIHNELFLTGYCRVCDQAVSKQIPHVYDAPPLVTRMDIPKWGCSDPNVI